MAKRFGILLLWLIGIGLFALFSLWVTSWFCATPGIMEYIGYGIVSMLILVVGLSAIFGIAYGIFALISWLILGEVSDDFIGDVEHKMEQKKISREHNKMFKEKLRKIRKQQKYEKGKLSISKNQQKGMLSTTE